MVEESKGGTAAMMPGRSGQSDNPRGAAEREETVTDSIEQPEGGPVTAQSADPGVAAQTDSQDITVSEAPESHNRSGLASMAEVQQEIERAFERLLKSSWLRPSMWDFPSLKDTFEGKAPKVNVIDRDEEMLVEAELPGVKKSDIDVSLGTDSVTIKASHRTELDDEEGRYHRREISAGFYSRTVPLPEAPDVDGASARFENGLLILRIPKAGQSQRRSLEIG